MLLTVASEYCKVFPSAPQITFQGLFFFFWHFTGSHCYCSFSMHTVYFVQWSNIKHQHKVKSEQMAFFFQTCPEPRRGKWSVRSEILDSYCPGPKCEVRGQSEAPHMNAGTFLGFKDILGSARTFVRWSRGFSSGTMFDKRFILMLLNELWRLQLLSHHLAATGSLPSFQ